MGYLTRQQIVLRGLRNAGVSLELETRANEWLNTWLDARSADWPWPQLQRRVTGVSLLTGAQSVEFGAGNGGVTPRVHRILDPLYLYNTGYTTRTEARIRQLTGGSVEDDETAQDPDKNKGVPLAFKARPHPTTQGAWLLIPEPFPDRDLFMAVDYLEWPDPLDESVSGNSSIPWYPNDRTMEQAVKQQALAYDQRHDIAAAELDILGGMVLDDRIKFGSKPGINDQWGLDPNYFRHRRRL